MIRKLLIVPLLAFSLCRAAVCAPTDIVPRGSALNDTFAHLALSGLLPGSAPSDFLWEQLHTRAELAHLLETAIRDNTGHEQALRPAILMLRPELAADGVDVGTALAALSPVSSLTGFVQPEARLGTESGAFGIYRVAGENSLSRNTDAHLSLSNWPEEWRQFYDNDIGSHDFSGVNEAYVEARGGRGLTFAIGRLNDHWGPGYRGATLLSDNAPPFDQLQVTFPFSLGRRFGRNYRYSQMAATFHSQGTRLYYEARRVEYNLSPQWTADFQEGFIASRARALVATPLPDFYDVQNSRVLGFRGVDSGFNSAVNFGLSYASRPVRLYGQFFIDDLRTPGKNSGITPRKIAYLVGTAVRPFDGTSVIVEYNFADPTTYSSRSLATQWQEGRFDQTGLPGGPNTRELFVHIDQRVTSHFSFALEGRDRRRHDDSFPAPTARNLAAFASYHPNNRSSLDLALYNYRQDPFPLAPDAPVGNGFQPTNSEGNYGQRLRLRRAQISYQFFF